MKKVLNRYENRKTKEIREIWETEQSYCNHSFKFDEEWRQIK